MDTFFHVSSSGVTNWLGSLGINIIAHQATSNCMPDLLANGKIHHSRVYGYTSILTLYI